MTAEQKAKAYDEALDRASKVHKYSSDLAEIKRMEDIFPVLAESEDESIRGAIIDHLKDYNLTEWAAWLEKQGEQKPFDYENATIVQKDFAPKEEPRFNIGDWIVSDKPYINNYYRLCKVVGISDGCYTVQTIDGRKGYITFEIWERDYHLWSIKDARDGDVLCCESGWTCIFKTLVNDENFSSYCFMDNTKWVCETGSECHTLKEEFVKAYNGKIYPATKEQCDT